MFFYKQEFKELIKKFKNSQYDFVPLWKISKITDGSHHSPPNDPVFKYKYVTVKDLDHHGNIDLDNCLTISEKNYNQLINNGCKPSEGDILFSKDGTIGKTYVIDKNDDFVVLSSLAIISPVKDMIIPAFLEFILRTDFILKSVKRLMGGSALKRIVLLNLKLLKIPLPKIEEQQEFLHLFNEININRLENIAKRKFLLDNFERLINNLNISLPIFEIVNFKLIRIKTLENALNVERYAFTYKIDEPKKWQTIKDIGTVKLNTLTPSDDGNKERDFTLLRIDDLPNKPFKTATRTVKGSQVEGNLQHIKTNDVLIARLAPTITNKKIVIAPESNIPIIGSNEFIRLTCNEENNPVFVCYLLRTEFYTKLMLSKSRGSTPSRYRLSRADFEKLPFPKVPKNIQDEIATEYLKNIEEALRLRKEGQEAVEQAKAEVERMILGE